MSSPPASKIDVLPTDTLSAHRHITNNTVVGDAAYERDPSVYAVSAPTKATEPLQLNADLLARLNALVHPGHNPTPAASGPAPAPHVPTVPRRATIVSSPSDALPPPISRFSAPVRPRHSAPVLLAEAAGLPPSSSARLRQARSLGTEAETHALPAPSQNPAFANAAAWARAQAQLRAATALPLQQQNLAPDPIRPDSGGEGPYVFPAHAQQRLLIRAPAGSHPHLRVCPSSHVCVPSAVSSAISVAELARSVREAYAAGVSWGLEEGERRAGATRSVGQGLRSNGTRAEEQIEVARTVRLRRGKEEAGEGGGGEVAERAKGPGLRRHGSDVAAHHTQLFAAFVKKGMEDGGESESEQEGGSAESGEEEDEDGKEEEEEEEEEAEETEDLEDLSPPRFCAGCAAEKSRPDGLRRQAEDGEEGGDGEGEEEEEDDEDAESGRSSRSISRAPTPCLVAEDLSPVNGPALRRRCAGAISSASSGPATPRADDAGERTHCTPLSGERTVRCSPLGDAEGVDAADDAPIVAAPPVKDVRRETKKARGREDGNLDETRSKRARY